MSENQLTNDEVKTLTTFDVQNAIIRARELRGAERILLYTLISFSGPKRGWTCYPSYRRLAVDSQLDRATVKRMAKSFQRRGYLDWERRGRRANYFQINASLIVQIADSLAAERAKRPVLQLSKAPQVAIGGKLAGNKNQAQDMLIEQTSPKAKDARVSSPDKACQSPAQSTFHPSDQNASGMTARVPDVVAPEYDFDPEPEDNFDPDSCEGQREDNDAWEDWSG